MSIYELQPIGEVEAARLEAEDDYWGGAISRLTLNDAFSAESLRGLAEFSHVEVIFLFDQVETAKIVTGARHPRNNPLWPQVGIFAQRGKNRPNRLGTTICALLKVEGSLLVAELDAINGTPIIDLKPVMAEFLPRTAVRQPPWSVELMRDYWLKDKPA
jgi:tRNA (Thr-GGU) A37 N-methylase